MVSNVKRKVSDVTKYKGVRRPTYWVVRESRVFEMTDIHESDVWIYG